jgi:hypothetical protein
LDDLQLAFDSLAQLVGFAGVGDDVPDARRRSGAEDLEELVEELGS